MVIDHIDGYIIFWGNWDKILSFLLSFLLSVDGTRKSLKNFVNRCVQSGVLVNLFVLSVCIIRPCSRRLLICLQKKVSGLENDKERLRGAMMLIIAMSIIFDELKVRPKLLVVSFLLSSNFTHLLTLHFFFFRTSLYILFISIICSTFKFFLQSLFLSSSNFYPSLTFFISYTTFFLLLTVFLFSLLNYLSL